MSTNKKESDKLVSENQSSKPSITLTTGLAILLAFLTIIPALLQAFPVFDNYQNGINYENRRKYDKAINSFKKEIENNPDNAAAYNELAWLYIDKTNSNFDDAIKLAQKAVKLTENDKQINHDTTMANYLDTLGWAYYKNGEYAKAVTTLERAIKLDNQQSYILHLETALKALKSIPTPTPTVAP